MQPGVLLLPKQKAIGRLSIAPRPSRLLVVLLNALGQRKVDHRAHRRLVDAQPESDRAHHHADFIGHPFLLILAPRPRIHLPVVRDGANAVFLEKVHRLPDPRDGRRIHDNVSIAHAPHGLKQHRHLRARIALAHHVTQVRSAETRYVLERLA